MGATQVECPKRPGARIHKAEGTADECYLGFSKSSFEFTELLPRCPIFPTAVSAKTACRVLR